MANLDHVLRQLREERSRAERQMQKLESAILVLERLGTGASSDGVLHSSRRGRIVSAAARRRMADAQRARWARTRQASANNKSEGKTARRALSADARRRIAAAQKARWARFRAQQQKQAA
jgi:hypothetical protein